MTASIGFYEQLGLHVTATHPTTTPDPDWASLEAHEAQLMLARADQPIDALTSRPLYLFARDLFRLRDRLIAAGIDAGDISDGSPVPAVEMRVEDPDRYVLMIALNDPDGADDDKPQA